MLFMCRAIEQGLATSPRLPSNDLLSNVDFSGFYVGESLSEDGMFSNSNLT